MPTKDELELKVTELQQQLEEASATKDQLSLLQLQLTDSEKRLKKAEEVAAVADKFSMRGRVAAAQASAGPQPSPALVSPGMVWDHEKKKPVPYEAPPSGRFKITSPNAKFRGERAGVSFRNGVGCTDDGDLIAFFENTLKYVVTDTAKAE